MKKYIHAYIEYDDFACGLYPECDGPYPVFHLEMEKFLPTEEYRRIRHDFECCCNDELAGMDFEVEMTNDGLSYTGEHHDSVECPLELTAPHIRRKK